MMREQAELEGYDLIATLYRPSIRTNKRLIGPTQRASRNPTK